MSRVVALVGPAYATVTAPAGRPRRGRRVIVVNGQTFTTLVAARRALGLAPPAPKRRKRTTKEDQP